MDHLHAEDDGFDLSLNGDWRDERRSYYEVERESDDLIRKYYCSSVFLEIKREDVAIDKQIVPMFSLDEMKIIGREGEGIFEINLISLL